MNIKEREMGELLLLIFLLGLGAGVCIGIYFTVRMKVTKDMLPFLILGIVFALIGIILVGSHV